MGDYITFSESLLVTFISMLTVFLVLVIISVLITGLKIIGAEKEEVEKVKKPAEKFEREEDSKEYGEFSPEIVAVISAAVASSLGLNPPDINIKTIKRVPSNSDN